MPVGKKWLVVLSVVATGSGTAYFFRKDASPPRQEATVENLFRQRVERRVSGDAAHARLSAQTAAPTGSRQALRVPTASTGEVPVAQLQGDPQPTFQKSLNPVAALLEPIEGIPPEAEIDEPAELDWPIGESRPTLAAESITHRVEDGDTLTRLAVRYLGRADGYQRIFELNRDVLSHPDLLPIGAVLKIPRADGARPAASGAEGDEAEPHLQMVPLSGRDRPSD